MKNKYVFLDITIIHGDKEFSSQGVHEISSSKNVDKFVHEYMMNFYGDDANAEKIGEDSYEYLMGEVIAEVRKTIEISKEEYEVLDKYI